MDRYQDLLEGDQIDALYIAVPHDPHATVYVDVIKTFKAILGEKSFGIGKAANTRITESLAESNAFVGCRSEIPLFSRAQRIVYMVRADAFGKFLDVEAGFWGSRDLNPGKPINWKR